MKSQNVQIINNVSYVVPEHQIVLTFSEDDQAKVFEIWWDKIGKKEFVEYYNENK